MDRTFDGIQVEEIYKISEKMRAFIVLAVLLVLGLLIYREALSNLIVSVLHKKDSSHGFCVPFISGYLVWLKFEKIREATPKFALVPGIVMVGAGLLLFFLVGDRAEIVIPVFSFLLVAAGLIVGLFGRDVFRQLRFPLFFLLTMIPVPKPWYTQMAEWMGWATTSGSVWVLKLFHFPIYQEGFRVSIPDMNFLIIESCSGIRHLLAYFVFGLAYAYVCKKTIKSRILVVLAAIPVSITGGVIRQSIIYLSAHYISPVVTEYRPHVLIGWLVFITVLGVAIWMDRWISKGIRWIEERRPGEMSAGGFQGASKA